MAVRALLRCLPAAWRRAQPRPVSSASSASLQAGIAPTNSPVPKARGLLGSRALKTAHTCKSGSSFSGSYTFHACVCQVAAGARRIAEAAVRGHTDTLKNEMAQHLGDRLISQTKASHWPPVTKNPQPLLQLPASSSTATLLFCMTRSVFSIVATGIAVTAVAQAVPGAQMVAHASEKPCDAEEYPWAPRSLSGSSSKSSRTCGTPASTPGAAAAAASAFVGESYGIPLVAVRWPSTGLPDRSAGQGLSRSSGGRATSGDTAGEAGHSRQTWDTARTSHGSLYSCSGNQGDGSGNTAFRTLSGDSEGGERGVASLHRASVALSLNPQSTEIGVGGLKEAAALQELGASSSVHTVLNSCRGGQCSGRWGEEVGSWQGQGSSRYHGALSGRSGKMLVPESVSGLVMGSHAQSHKSALVGRRQCSWLSSLRPASDWELVVLPDAVHGTSPASSPVPGIPPSPSAYTQPSGTKWYDPLSGEKAAPAVAPHNFGSPGSPGGKEEAGARQSWSLLSRELSQGRDPMALREGTGSWRVLGGWEEVGEASEGGAETLGCAPLEPLGRSCSQSPAGVATPRADEGFELLGSCQPAGREGYWSSAMQAGTAVRVPSLPSAGVGYHAGAASAAASAAVPAVTGATTSPQSRFQSPKSRPSSLVEDPPSKTPPWKAPHAASHSSNHFPWVRNQRPVGLQTPPPAAMSGTLPSPLASSAPLFLCSATHVAAAISPASSYRLVKELHGDNEAVVTSSSGTAAASEVVREFSTVARVCEGREEQELRDALQHSQSRAREAEDAAQTSAAAVQRMEESVLKESARSFSLRQWAQMLEIENMRLERLLTYQSHELPRLMLPAFLSTPVGWPHLHYPALDTRKLASFPEAILHLVSAESMEQSQQQQQQQQQQSQQQEATPEELSLLLLALAFALGLTAGIGGSVFVGWRCGIIVLGTMA